MNEKDVARVDVYKQDRRLGTLQRTTHGARFQYAPEALPTAPGGPIGLAFAMPPRPEPYDVFGTNLHPFFAGLLPEGLRLHALVRALKTSEDDLFSLLVASGADAVGDVAVAPPDSALVERTPVADIKRLSQVSFGELLAQSLAYESGRGDIAIAGVQPKVSAAMISFPLRARDKRKAYILKLTPGDYPRLVENEAFFMALAKSAGLSVARLRVVHDKEGQSALLIERFDRIPGGPEGKLLSLHQEDACQLLDRYPADKYRVDLSEVARSLEVCSAPLVERLKLLRMQAFSYLIANGDMHAKNVSVRVTDARVELTPCYDLLSTLPYGDQRLALSMEGRDDKLKRTHFLAFGERFGLPGRAVEHMLDELTKRTAKALQTLDEIGLEDKRTRQLERTMRERLAGLSA